MSSAPSVIDRALLGLRRGGAATAWRALFGGSLVAWVLLTAYYFEEVEGVRSLRPAFGMLLVLAFWGRAYFLAQVARSVVVPLLPKGAALPEMRFFDVARTASVVAIGLFFWSWLPVVGSYIGLAAAAASLAPLCLRGAIAPTWLARAGVEAGGGVMAFVAAFRDLGRERGKGVLIELMLLLGIVVVCANLVAAMGAVSLLARSFLGLDIAVVEAFFSTDNTFVLLVLGAISAVALEPLRAAVSAVLYVEARARRDGFDLAAAVRALAPLGSRGAGAALVLTLSLGVCSFAVAQEPPSDMPAAEPLEDEALTPRDWAVLDGVDAALARSEFEEHSGVRRGQSIRALVERFFDWLLRNRDLDLEREGNSGPKLGMPPASVFVAIACALLAVVTIAAWSARKRATAETSEDTGEAAAEADPRDRPPESHLDEAAQLAASGAYREAFRALYLATLVALDRRGAIAFDRSRTNWHYLRSMRGGPTREAFHRFTALFDRKWYGDEATSELDYRLGRELADSICASASGGST